MLASAVPTVIKAVQCVVAVPQLPLSPQHTYPVGLPFHLHSVSKMSPSGAAEMTYHMFFQRSQVQYLALTWQCTTTSNSSLPSGLHRYLEQVDRVHTHAGKTSHIHERKKVFFGPR